MYMMLFNQVNKLFFKRNVFKQILRFSHSKTSPKVLHPLESRKLLRIKGDDTSVFLQGLITNDMRHFEEGASSMYAMFLNNKGRVLYDTLLYKWEDGKSFMIECDKDALTTLLRHLKLYKLKRAVEIEDVSQHLRVWAFISSNDPTDLSIDTKRAVNVYKDPRLSDLGYRILSTTNLEGSEIAENIDANAVIECNENGYKYLRYKLGVSEGSEDLPPGTCFPLEVNCDYLHGVSFHKGCYIGQELTARVHHTGVVRKRIMPLKISRMPNESLEKEMIISANDNPKSNIGKLKGFLNERGIGLLRTKEALDAKVLNIGNHKIAVMRPSWWPVEAPKEKLITKNV